MYGNSNMNYVFYSGKQYDSVTGVNYGAASNIGMNYAVQWYVYDAQGNYITTVLSAGIADVSSNNTDTYIGKQLEDMGYAVDGKSVAICYDKPRYMYGDWGNVSNSANSINSGPDFDAYRFEGQWIAAATTDTVRVNVEVAMMTDSGEVLANSNTAGYGNATASLVQDVSFGKPNYASTNGSWAQTAATDAKLNGIQLDASAQNFIGWYYYDANTGEFTKSTYTDNENFYPNYSNKDVTFYAMYRASAIYQYKYTGREGARTYSAAGNDLTEDELVNNSVIDPASHQADIISKLPVGIGVFKKNIDFSESSYDTWRKTPDDKGYILDISGFEQTTPEYTLTIHFKYDNGSTVEDVTVTDKAVYNGKAIDLTDGTYNFTPKSGEPVTKFAGKAITSYHNQSFRGWFAYNDGSIGELISTQRNYGLRLTGNQDIIAVYDDDSSYQITDGWNVSIDENVLNKELTTSTTGVFYNDTIVRVRDGADVTAKLPDNSKIGVLVVCDNKTDNTINAYTTEQLNTLVTSITVTDEKPGKTVKTGKGLSITNMQSTSQTNFNRTDIAVRSTYEKNLGAKYCVYAYFYNGDNKTYTFSAVSDVKTYE